MGDPRVRLPGVWCLLAGMAAVQAIAGCGPKPPPQVGASAQTQPQTRGPSTEVDSLQQQIQQTERSSMPPQVKQKIESNLNAQIRKKQQTLSKQ